jgi:hypothetical protein
MRLVGSWKHHVVYAVYIYLSIDTPNEHDMQTFAQNAGRRPSVKASSQKP